MTAIPPAGSQRSTRPCWNRRQPKPASRRYTPLARAEQLLLQSGVVLPLYTSMSHYAVSTEVQNAWIDPGEGIIYLKYITKS